MKQSDNLAYARDNGITIDAKHKPEIKTMNIKNTTTGKTIELIYAPNGCDALPDIINQGAEVEMTSEEIAWWAEWVTEQEAFDAAREDAREDLDSDERDELEEAIQDAQSGCDMESHPRAGVEAIRDFMAARA